MWQEKTTGQSFSVLSVLEGVAILYNVSAAAVLVGQQVLNPCGRRR
jgi:hypothetical protein